MHLLWLLCSSLPNEIFSWSREIAAELWAQPNGRAVHDSSHLAPVQHLGWVSAVKHRPSKPPLQAGYPNHGKTDFLWLHWRAHFRKDELGDFVSGGEKRLPLSSLKLHHFQKTLCDQVFPTLKSWNLRRADCEGELLWSTMTLTIYTVSWNCTCTKKHVTFLEHISSLNMQHFNQAPWEMMRLYINKSSLVFFAQWSHAWCT